MWRGPVDNPPEAEMRRIGASSIDVLIVQARKIAGTIQAQLAALGIGEGARVLDFGAGIGRVAMPLYEATNLPTDACDVNSGAVKYLSSQLPDLACETTNFSPPLPYSDETFEAVYSISLWTHFPEDAGLAWLKEIKRILKPGGVALLSTSGTKVIEVRAARRDAGWSNYTVEDLERAGVLYEEYKNLSEQAPAYPGVTSSYGLTAHHPDYIKAQWSKILPVEDILIEAIDGVQDLVILKKG